MKTPELRISVIGAGIFASPGFGRRLRQTLPAKVEREYGVATRARRREAPFDQELAEALW